MNTRSDLAKLLAHGDAIDPVNRARIGGDPTPTGLRPPAQGCASPPSSGSTLGSSPAAPTNPERVASSVPNALAQLCDESRQFSPAPKPLVIEADYIPAGTGPDYLLLVMRDGRAIQINDDGITVWRNVALCAAADRNPEHSLTFTP